MACPLIVVCGTTGVGKSKLAIELALHISNTRWKRARIINADAMQVYAGMDIITNKISESERAGVEHCLMGFKQPGEQYVVGQWVKDAMKLIEESHQNSEVPIVVGGTTYWIQHLLFPDRLVNPSPDSSKESTSEVTDRLNVSLASLPPDLLNLFNSLPEQPPLASTDPEAAFALHNLLSALDPSVAARWHWRDTRKVHRSLCILKDTGRTVTDIIDRQSQHFDVRPRYRTLCFWLYAETEILRQRLNDRVDQMIQRGLLDEVKDLVNIVNSSDAATRQSSAEDYSLGIFQSIGKRYREFHNLISLPEPTKKDFAAATERMKISTRQYAKRQISWIRSKLLPVMYAANTEETLTHTYLLDATDLNQWARNVCTNAVEIMEDFLQDRDLRDPFTLSDVAQDILAIQPKPTDPMVVLKARRKVVCSICTVDSNQPVMIEEGQQWELHQKTKAHRRLARKNEQE